MWEIKPDLYSNLEYDVLSKILASGKDRFDNTFNELKEIRNKSFTIIAILISFLGILVPSMITKYNGITEAEYEIIFLLIATATLVTVWAVIELLKNVYPKRIHLPGEEPKSVNYEEMFSTPDEHQLYVYLVNEIENIQTKITFNKSIVNAGISSLEHVLKVIPLVYILLLLLTMIIIKL